MPWPYVVAAGLGLVGTALGVRESRKNREWQERMSSTAHQRETADMMRAGINPIMSASGGSGASTPSGSVADFSGIERTAGNALAIKQVQANIELTNAQALKARTEAYDLQTTAPMRYQQLGNVAALSDLDWRQKSQLFDTVVAQAKAQLDATSSSARASKARAALDELDSARAMNAKELEEWLKGGSPGVRLFLDVLRSLRR